MKEIIKLSIQILKKQKKMVSAIEPQNDLKSKYDRILKEVKYIII